MILRVFSYWNDSMAQWMQRYRWVPTQLSSGEGFDSENQVWAVDRWNWLLDCMKERQWKGQALPEER